MGGRLFCTWLEEGRCFCAYLEKKRSLCARVVNDWGHYTVLLLMIEREKGGIQGTFLTQEIDDSIFDIRILAGSDLIERSRCD